MHPQRANIPLQGLDRCALTAGAIYEIPTVKLEASFGAISPVVDLHGKEHSGNVDQSTLASGGSEHSYLV